MEKRYIDSENFGVDGTLLPPIKRVAAIHDLSSVGRCALTVIIPVLSAMGIQAVPLPTALLSTHTGGFTNMHFRDLTDDMEKMSAHWHEIGVDFDSIYSGFLGSYTQIDTVLRFIDAFGQKKDGRSPLILVDPVMGDDGKLYSTYTDALVEGMKKLCRKADIITPNITEACLLTDTRYIDCHFLSSGEMQKKIKELMTALYSIYGTKKIVITGIVTDDSTVTNAIFDAERCDIREEGAIDFYSHRQLSRSYPGTGDIFASVLLSKYLSGVGFGEAVYSASDVVAFLIGESERYRTPIRDGVVLEPYLNKITDM